VDRAVLGREGIDTRSFLSRHHCRRRTIYSNVPRHGEDLEVDGSDCAAVTISDKRVAGKPFRFATAAGGQSAEAGKHD
jgi:hypothetical protein